ncbi:MAG: lipid A biosynthesis acyltransferase [Wenzhouxiangellaceae bacterium]
MPHWREQSEGGSRLSLLIIRWSILNIGRGFARLCMFPTTLYFFIVRGHERRASRAWLERVGAPQRGTLGVLRHIYTFAMTIVDRVLLFSGREHELEIHTEGEEDLIAALRRGKGCLLLGAHLGSFDALRAFSHQAPEDCRHLKVVMDRSHNSLMTRVMEDLQPELRDRVIEARNPGAQIVLEVAEVLSAGGMVAMLGDRGHHLEPTDRVAFIGEPAPFPISPLSIAWILDVPVFLGLGLYEGGRSYRLVFEPLERPGPHTTDRKQRRALLDQWLANYARRLEYYARHYPYNWFNFYDFWNPD